MSILNGIVSRLLCKTGDSLEKVFSKTFGNWKLVCGIALICYLLHAHTSFFERAEKGWLDLSLANGPITADGLGLMSDAVAKVLKKGHHKIEPLLGCPLDILFGFGYTWIAYRIPLLKNPYVAVFVLPAIMNYMALNFQLFLGVSLDFSIMLWGLKAHDLFKADRKEKELEKEIAELTEQLRMEREGKKDT
jgi:hypothetical protein